MYSMAILTITIFISLNINGYLDYLKFLLAQWTALTVKLLWENMCKLSTLFGRHLDSKKYWMNVCCH